MTSYVHQHRYLSNRCLKCFPLARGTRSAGDANVARRVGTEDFATTVGGLDGKAGHSDTAGAVDGAVNVGNHGAVLARRGAGEAREDDAADLAGGGTGGAFGRGGPVAGLDLGGVVARLTDDIFPRHVGHAASAVRRPARPVLDACRLGGAAHGAALEDAVSHDVVRAGGPCQAADRQAVGTYAGDTCHRYVAGSRLEGYAVVIIGHLGVLNGDVGRRADVETVSVVGHVRRAADGVESEAGVDDVLRVAGCDDVELRCVLDRDAAHLDVAASIQAEEIGAAVGGVGDYVVPCSIS